MTKISWDSTGEKRFEAGLDRGVLYPDDDSGVPWNGLISVTDSSTGGETTPYYEDSVKYANVPDAEDFSGTIEAFTYPEEFEVFDGYEEVYAGISASQQYRDSFDMAYRTKIGNDVQGLKHGYKIHLAYNVQVAPSSRAHGTQTETPEALNFSWGFTTTPINFKPGVKPMAHLVLDSTKINSLILEAIEEILYGTDLVAPRMVMPDDIIAIFGAILPGYFGIDENFVTGISPIVAGGGSDLIVGVELGLYLATPVTRLTLSATTGIYTLEV